MPGPAEEESRGKSGDIGLQMALTSRYPIAI
jgi:hypothetical protein